MTNVKSQFLSIFNILNIRVSSNKAELMEYFKSMGLVLLILCLRMYMFARHSEFFFFYFRPFCMMHTQRNRWIISNSAFDCVALCVLVKLELDKQYRSGYVDFLSRIKHMFVDEVFFSFSCCIEWYRIRSVWHVRMFVCVACVFFPISISYLYSQFVFIAFTLFWYLFERVCVADTVFEVLLLPPLVFNILKNAHAFIQINLSKFYAM